MKEYGDNIIQLEIEKQKLRNLEDDRNSIMQKYLPGSKSIDILKDINSYIPGSKNKKRTSFDDFMIELEEKKILSSIDECEKNIKILTKRISKFEQPLDKIKGYEKRLYLYMLKGNNITQAVKRVAEESDRSERTLWRYAKRLRRILIKYEIDEKISIFL